MPSDQLLPKIFCIGLPRTGTTSLDVALDGLKIRSVHFVMDLYRDRQAPVLESNQAFSDSPIPLLYKEFDARFPGSKFVLTRRGLESWLASMEWLFKHGKVKWCWNYTVHAYHEEFFGTRRFDRLRFTAKYHTYHREVADYFRGREADLLVIDLDQGFDMARLCNFLGRPEVKVEFPRANQRDLVPLSQRLLYAVYERLLVSEASDMRFRQVMRRVLGGRFGR